MATINYRKNRVKSKRPGFWLRLPFVRHFIFRSRLRLIDQLIGFFALIVLIPLLLLSFVIYNINHTALKKQVRYFTEVTADASYQKFAHEMSWQHKISILGKHEMQRVLASPPNTQMNAMQQFYKSFPDVLSVDFVLDPKNVPIHQRVTSIYRWINPKAMAASSDFYARFPLRLDKSIQHIATTMIPVFELLADNKSQQYYLRVWVPDNENHGVWVFQKSFQYLQELIAQNIREFHQNFTLIAPNGKIIAASLKDTIGQAIDQDLYTQYRHLSPGQNLKIASGSDSLVDSSDDKHVNNKNYVVLLKLPEIGWGVILQSPYAVQKQYIRTAQVQSIMLVFACVVLIIFLGIWYSRGLYRNFRQLIKGIQALAEGKYSRQVRLITRAFTPYEIIYLTAEFNRMSEKISTAWEDIKHLNKQLGEANVQLAQLDETKQNLIDTVSHELRTPLTSIKGYTARLIRNYDHLSKDEQLQSLKIVKNQADRLSRLVEDLLVIPDLEEQSMAHGAQFALRIFPDRVDLIQLALSCVASIQGKSEYPIQVDLPKESVEVWVDPDRMEQIILNLLDNAVKYCSDDAFIRLTLKVENNKSHLSVFNSCEPISDEEISRLFQKFSRLDQRLTRTSRGTGLGLYITKGLVKAMGGEITAYYDNGFYINVVFPLVTDAARQDYSAMQSY